MAESRRLWAQVQIALAAWLPVHFAPVYRQMELRQLDQRIRQRVLALEGTMQKERVNALRGAIGLHHLKKLGVGKGSRRMRFHGHLPQQAATEVWQQQRSESPATPSANGSATTPS